MSWVRIDDQMTSHPKILNAGPEAAWLFVCGLTYCASQLTDGLIPTVAVPMLSALKRPKRAAKALVEAGLWEPTEGGYRVHDYLVYQPEAAAVRAERKAARQRKFRPESGRNPAGVRPDSGDPVPIPSHPGPARPLIDTRPELELKNGAAGAAGFSVNTNGVKSSGGGDDPLERLRLAFEAQGEAMPALVGFEERHARSLLRHFLPEDIARGWRAIERGELGDDHDREHLSFQQLTTRNRFGRLVSERSSEDGGAVLLAGGTRT